MWSGYNKVWLNYTKSIIAADRDSGRFLSSYLRFSIMNKVYVSNLEVIDLQRYRVIKDKSKVNKALNTRIDMPFVFVVGKN